MAIQGEIMWGHLKKVTNLIMNLSNNNIKVYESAQNFKAFVYSPASRLTDSDVYSAGFMMGRIFYFIFVDTTYLTDLP